MKRVEKMDGGVDKDKSLSTQGHRVGESLFLGKFEQLFIQCNTVHMISFSLTQS